MARAEEAEMDEQREKNTIWSVVTIAILIIGFVLNSWMIVSALDAKIDTINSTVTAMCTTDNVKSSMDGLKARLDALERQMQGMVPAGAAAPAAPPAVVPAPAPEAPPAQ
jgi:hypothetical protein